MVTEAARVPRGLGSARVTPAHSRFIDSRAMTYMMRTLVVACAVLAWQFLPKIQWFSSRYHFLNVVFISSPSLVARRIVDYSIPRPGGVLIWPYLGDTVLNTLEGFMLGAAAGLFAGLVMSSWAKLYDVFGVYFSAINSMPRIVLVPIVFTMFGPGKLTTLTTTILMVFFLMFFNCYTGGRSVPTAVLQNAIALKAKPATIMFRIRLRYVLLWAFAAVPAVLSFSLVAVIFVEVYSSSGGIGLLLTEAVNALDATRLFALIVFMSVAGVLMQQLSEVAKRRLLHWYEPS